MQVIKYQEEKPFEELKNIGKNKTQKANDEISKKNKQTKKNDEGNKLLFEFRKIDETMDNAGLVCTKTDKRTKYDFNRFSLPLKFIENIYNYKITPNEAIEKQAELKDLINKLNKGYNRRNAKKAKEKNDVLRKWTSIA